MLLSQFVILAGAKWNKPWQKINRFLGLFYSADAFWFTKKEDCKWLYLGTLLLTSSWQYPKRRKVMEPLLHLFCQKKCKRSRIFAKILLIIFQIDTFLSDPQPTSNYLWLLFFPQYNDLMFCRKKSGIIRNVARTVITFSPSCFPKPGSCWQALYKCEQNCW